jgi:hypothetical protein
MGYNDNEGLWISVQSLSSPGLLMGHDAKAVVQWKWTFPVESGTDTVKNIA